MKKILLLLLSVVLFSCESDSPTYDVEKPTGTSTIGYITEPTIVDGKLVDVTYKYDKKLQEFMTRFQNYTFEKIYSIKYSDEHAVQYTYTIKFGEVRQRKDPQAFPKEKLGLIEFYIGGLLTIDKKGLWDNSHILDSSNHSFTFNIGEYRGDTMLVSYYANGTGYTFIHYIDGNTIKLETNQPVSKEDGVYYKK